MNCRAKNYGAWRRWPIKLNTSSQKTPLLNRFLMTNQTYSVTETSCWRALKSTHIIKPSLRRSKVWNEMLYKNGWIKQMNLWVWNFSMKRHVNGSKNFTLFTLKILTWQSKFQTYFIADLGRWLTINESYLMQFFNYIWIIFNWKSLSTLRFPTRSGKRGILENMKPLHCRKYG